MTTHTRCVSLIWNFFLCFPGKIIEHGTGETKTFINYTFLIVMSVEQECLNIGKDIYSLL